MKTSKNRDALAEWVHYYDLEVIQDERGTSFEE